MKKMFFYAALATAALTSCSKDSGFEVPSVEENGTKETIQFNLSSNINVTTRGKGAVGGTGTDEDPNVWNSEVLHVYMFNKGTMELALDSTNTENHPNYNAYFENDTIIAYGAVDNNGTFKKYTGKYYGQNKYNVYDFYAYHVDDAINGAPTYNDVEKAYQAGVTIDGSQDIMVAKAGLNKEDEDKLKDADKTRVYSAYSARRDVHPRFAFNHELSRFVFNAISANDKAEGIRISSVVVKKAQNEATMTVAALDETKLGLSGWKGEVDFSLKNMDPYAELGKKGDTLALGAYNQPKAGSLLLAPKAKVNNEAATYDLTVEYTDGEGRVAVFNSAITAPAKTGDEFKKGYIYTVNIMVYGFEEITLVCDLKKWEDGGHIDVGGDE